MTLPSQVAIETLLAFAAGIASYVMVDAKGLVAKAVLLLHAYLDRKTREQESSDRPSGRPDCAESSSSRAI